MIWKRIKLMQLTIGFSLILAVFLAPEKIFAKADIVTVITDEVGSRLLVNGEDFMINGMNWGYVPIGENYNYSLWKQPDDVIKSAVDTEMSLLKNMGVNVIRQYTGIPAKWITYIYQKYGIYTILNHSFGRYGLTLDGTWVANTDYSDPRVRKVLLSEVAKMVKEFKNTPGLLMFLLGNENNYGLFWGGAETEDIPIEDRKSTKRAQHMYKLFNKAAIVMKKYDASHPIAICNGDLLFMEIIAKECKDFDVYATNMYRGVSFGDAFQRIRKEYNKPVMFSEFGADAFNARDNEEDQKSQAYYMVGNWKEIYENAYGMGKEGNSIGGFTFQFSDGWWKYEQTKNLNIHDNNASWANGGYQSDFVEGENNMNEEWFGICAKGKTNARGLYQLYPRAAYYALKDVHSLNPFEEGMTAEKIKNHFSNIQLMDAVVRARGDRAALVGEQSETIKISGLRLEMTTFNTGGDKTSTPNDPVAGSLGYPNAKGFDHMESFYFDLAASPSPSVRGMLSVNVLGHIADNPIDEVFYENRGRTREVNTDNGNLTLGSINRVKVYKASINWNSRLFDLEGFYRTGHYHWGYEGDFFGLYPEANYGPNIDMYNGDAPIGVELTGKKSFRKFKVAFGPELWWGANPAILVKYQRNLGPFQMTGIFHEDIDEQGTAVSSFAIPAPPTRRATIHLETQLRALGIELGGIWAGEPRVGETFQIVDGTSGNYNIYQDEIKSDDTYGGKVKLTFSKGRINWYAQGAVMGLVAGGGADATQTFTGWRLKDSGSGNQYNFLTGFTFGIGNLQIAPNFLWQKPIEGPIPGDVQAPGKPRNVLNDPFAVRGNRETTAGELLITFDPTPATWMYSWDNDMAEDATFAISANFIFRQQPTTIDAAPYVAKDGTTVYVHPSGTPARDVWEAHARIVSKLSPQYGLIANLYAGEGEPNGDDERLINRYGGDIRFVLKSIKLTTTAKIDDWGPFDYHRDHNLTYPLQLMADISTVAGKPAWFSLPQTRLGVRFTWRSLDQYSTRYYPDETLDYDDTDLDLSGYDEGDEWEIRTYLHFNIGM